ncbi:GAF domain-containing protein [Bacteroidota bacterium]
MNPNVRIGNGLYFLVFMILILATTILVLHILVERKINLPPETDREIDEESDTEQTAVESLTVPFEVDIDIIAREIIPRIDPKEPLGDYAERILLNLSRHFEIVQGIIYLRNSTTKDFESLCTYAYTSDQDPAPFKEGDGLVGQAAKNKKIMNFSSIPEGYLEVQSGLGKSSPDNLIIIPLLLNKETIGIMELASFHPLDKKTEWTFMNLSKIIGNSIVTKIKSTEKK